MGGGVGAFATHIDDILGCGEPDVSPKIRGFPGQRYGATKFQEDSFVDVGMELEQEANFSVTFGPGESSVFGANGSGATRSQAPAGRRPKAPSRPELSWPKLSGAGPIPDGASDVEVPEPLGPKTEDSPGPKATLRIFCWGKGL